MITTCSPKNYALVKKLGASQVFDYNSETVVSDILSYLEGKVIAGALASMLPSLVHSSKISFKPSLDDSKFEP